MKRFLRIAIPILIVLAGLAVARSHAQDAPLPSTLDTTGYGPYQSELIQPASDIWYVHMDYTPLNQSASLTIENADHTIRDYKLTPAPEAASIELSGQGTTPVYIDAYAGNRHIWLSYSN